LKFKNNRH